jgi:flavin reductase
MEAIKDSVNRGMFLEAMRRAAASVTVVTTGGAAGRGGLTLSAMCSLSADPPAVLVCINQLSPALERIRTNGNFCVNLLGREHKRVAEVFAGQVAELRHDRFACTEWEEGVTGAPMLAHSLAALECVLEDEAVYATHKILIGRVINARVSSRDPLIYLDRSYHEIGPRVDVMELVR